MSKSQSLLYSMSSVPAPKLARVFAALSVGPRIRIMRNIAKHGTFGAWKQKQGRGCTIKEAGIGLRIGWPTLSHHVAVLEKAGVIAIQRQGRNKKCWITTEAIGMMSEFFMSLSPRVVSDPTENQMKDKIEQHEKLLKDFPPPRRSPKVKRRI